MDTHNFIMGKYHEYAWCVIDIKRICYPLLIIDSSGDVDGLLCTWILNLTIQYVRLGGVTILGAQRGFSFVLKCKTLAYL